MKSLLLFGYQGQVGPLISKTAGRLPENLMTQSGPFGVVSKQSRQAGWRVDHSRNRDMHQNLFQELVYLSVRWRKSVERV